MKGLDEYITGHYGEDQFRRAKQPCYKEKRDNFLESLLLDAYELGHSPFPWTKGAHGYYTHCRGCGAMLRCNVSTFTVKEFPAKKCLSVQQES